MLKTVKVATTTKKFYNLSYITKISPVDPCSGDLWIVQFCESSDCELTLSEAVLSFLLFSDRFNRKKYGKAYLTINIEFIFNMEMLFLFCGVYILFLTQYRV